MAMTSGKNMALSSAATDLGLGDEVKAQLQADDDERKKKLLQASGKGQALGGLIGQPTSAANALGIGSM
jgi:hypothetical protein